jgi:hypothetical protein
MGAGQQKPQLEVRAQVKLGQTLEANPGDSP